MHTFAVRNRVGGYSSSPKISKFLSEDIRYVDLETYSFHSYKIISKDLSLTKIVNFIKTLFLPYFDYLTYHYRPQMVTLLVKTKLVSYRLPNTTKTDIDTRFGLQFCL